MSYHTGSNNNRSSQPSSTPPASTPPVTPQPRSTPASTPPVTRQQTYVSPTVRSTPEQRSGGSNNRAGLEGSAGNNRGENGPFSVGGYCPLYTTSRAAVAASPYPDMIRIGEKSKGFHVHVIDGGRYYMPNGLVMGETQFHGDCPQLIPAPEFGDDGTVINPEGYVPSLTIGGGKIRFPMKPSFIQNGSKEEMWYMTQRQEWRDECKQGSPPEYCYGDTAEEREGKGMEFWKAETDEEWREWVRDHLSKESFFSNNDPIYAAYVDELGLDGAYNVAIQTWIERFGEDPIAVRNTYLNENTTGWILLDWESPVNFGALTITSQSDLKAFVEGVIRRVNILREFMPNAKFGLWRFGDGRNPRYSGAEVNKFLRRQVYASTIEYQGKTLFDALDFLSPTLYQYAYFEFNEPIALSRIRNGERVQRSKNTCDSIFEEHGEVKPVVPIIHNTYLLSGTEFAGAADDDAALPGDDLAYQLNALELEYWGDYASHFAYWYARTEDLYDHYYHRDLLLRYYDETYREPYMGDQGTPVPIDPNFSIGYDPLSDLETETTGEPPEERRLEVDNNSNNSQRNTYENGKRIPGNFPTAFQNSINQAVPDGQKCGNCKLFNQNNAYCSAWKATANKNYWCQSYIPYVNITMNGAAVSSSGGVFSLRGSNNKLITYKKGTTVVYDGELYEVTKSVSGQLPDKSSSFVKITNIDDNVVDGGSFGETASVTRTPVRRSSGGSSSSSSGSGSGGGY